MDTATLTSTLTPLGLNDSDATVYVLLNTDGESDVPKLMNRTKLSRTAIYHCLNRLTERKLIEQRKSGKNAYYSMTDPRNLQVLFEEKKRSDNELERAFRNNLTDLANRYQRTSRQPGVSFFHGKAEIIEMYEQFYQDNEPVDSIEEAGEMLKFLGDYAQTYVRKRIEHHMPNRCIAPDVNTMNTTDPKQLREVRLVPTHLFPFRMDIKIAGLKTLLVTFNHNQAIGVSVDSQEIADNFRILFNFLWTTVNQVGIGDPRIVRN